MINRTKGFTLIEIMVVVAIVGIISAIAFPSYDNYMRRAKRTDASAALSMIADRQERNYLQANTYSSTLAGINVAGTSDDGYYTLKMDAGDANTFKATATAISTSDPTCKYMTIDSIGAKNGGPLANPTDDSNNCW